MRRKAHPLATFAKSKKQIVEKIENIFVYQAPSNSNKIAGRIALLNITTCIHCMKCIQSCPIHVFEIKESENSKTILPIGERNCIQCQKCAVNCPSDSIYIHETFMNGLRIALREHQTRRICHSRAVGGHDDRCGGHRSRRSAVPFFCMECAWAHHLIASSIPCGGKKRSQNHASNISQDRAPSYHRHDVWHRCRGIGCKRLPRTYI